jgi:hypothetical protein
MAERVSFLAGRLIRRPVLDFVVRHIAKLEAREQSFPQGLRLAIGRIPFETENFVCA